MTDTSKTSGDWYTNSTWTQGVPTGGTDAKIAARDIVTLSGGAYAADLTIASKGTFDLNEATFGTANGTTDNGEIIGTGDILGPLGGTGTVIADGGTLEVSSSVDALNQGLSLQIGAEATLKLDGSVGAPASLLAGDSKTYVDFTTGGTLDLSGEGGGSFGELSDFQATVANFAAGDTIEVAGSGASTDPDQVFYNAKTDILSVTSADGKLVDQVYLSGNYKGDTFSLASANGDDFITLSSNSGGPPPLCFFAGTMIRTPDGDVAVEALKRGDLVLTTDGVAKPVSWLGRQTVSTLFADPLKVWPIRVRAGALGDNIPSRDLVLSPDHALWVDGALFHAAALVNGTSITREFKAPRVFVYYHVELDDHSLIYAENTPAETFIDNADRLAFDNWAEHEALYPEGKPIDELPYARAKGPRQVPTRTRVALAERARRLGLLTAEVA